MITWEVSADGLIPVARTHFELLSAAIAVVLESRIEPDAKILSSLAIGSFAGLAMTVLPWLVVGGTLSLHHPFDAARLRRAMRGRALPDMSSSPARWRRGLPTPTC